MTDHSPTYQAKMFRCPTCEAITQQGWSELQLVFRIPNLGSFQGQQVQPDGAKYSISCCYVCHHPALWKTDSLVWPLQTSFPAASPDMPENVRSDYEEARLIASISPKAAAALLRLAIQRLCVHLGGTGDNLNADIGQLVKDGLPPKIQQALDVVRVIGNNGVHPGQISIDDDPRIVAALFNLVNIVVEDMISQPAQVKGLFEALPATAKEQVKKRDGS
jgi:Domain of unknown function (DUF4145)